MKAVIMAGGEGGRLRPLTCTVPKPAADILGRPTLFYVLDSLLTLDSVTEVILTLKYKASEIASLFPDGEYKGLAVTFVIEDEPRGTAGSVKNALPESDETILVLSGDAYFDFDLNKCMDYHTESGEKVTIICKPVDDPREYGVVNTDENNNIIGFLEKPGWGGAVTDLANTGIYFIEPEILDLIPENIPYDFAKDLFPSLLKGRINMKACVSSDYWCDIGDIESYKRVQFDILSGKTQYKPERVAEGAFTSSDVPNGDYIITPPVFFGKNVQIENGAIIGPNSVISDGCLISKGSKIRDSVLLQNVYVSAGCSINSSLLCDSVSVKRGAALFEGSAIGSDTIIGEDAVVANNVYIWPKKTVENGETVTENMKYSKPSSTIMRVNSVIFGDFGVELTPEKAARFGAAIGSLDEALRIGVGVDGETNSIALKCGILGGLISTGAKSFDFGKCFNSQMFYYSAFCELDIAVFISGGNEGVAISLCECGGISLSREHQRRLELILKHNEFNRCSGGDCQSVSVMNSMEQMYMNELLRQFASEKAISNVTLITSNSLVSKCFEEAVLKLGGTNDNDNFIVKINDSATSASIIEKEISFSFEKLLAVVSYDELSKGNDVALPWEAPEVITALAGRFGRHIYRYSENYFDNDDLRSVISIGTKQLWSRDAMFLVIKLLSIMSEKNESLSKLVSELPQFYISKKVIEIDVSPATISKKLLDGDFVKGSSDGVFRENEKGSAKIRSDSNGKNLKIIAEAYSSEAADEICAEIESIINAAALDNISK